MWALTCFDAVKAVTDFWGAKQGNSWKTVMFDCFLNFSDVECFDRCIFNLTAFLPVGSQGLVTSIVHDTENMKISLIVELAIKDGTYVNDATYWTYVSSACTLPLDTPGTEVEADPICAGVSYDTLAKIAHTLYRIVIIDVMWGIGLNEDQVKISYELQGKGVWDAVKHTKVYDVVQLADNFFATFYTNNPHNPLLIVPATLVLGVGSVTINSALWKWPVGRKSKSMHMSVDGFTNKQIKTGIVSVAKKGHL